MNVLHPIVYRDDTMITLPLRVKFLGHMRRILASFKTDVNEIQLVATSIYDRLMQVIDPKCNLFNSNKTLYLIFDSILQISFDLVIDDIYPENRPLLLEDPTYEIFVLETIKFDINYP